MTDASSSSDYDPTDDYMSDADNMVFPPGTEWTDGWDVQANSGYTTTATEPENDVARSPGSLIASAYLANTISLVLLLVGSDIMNWIGYAISGFLGAVLIISYWGLDQQRRTLPNYAFAGHRTFLSVLSVIIGLVLAASHSVALSHNMVPA